MARSTAAATKSWKAVTPTEASSSKDVNKGNGMLKFKSGDVYVGEFTDNRMEGTGVYLYDAINTPEDKLSFDSFAGK